MQVPEFSLVVSTVLAALVLAVIHLVVVSKRIQLAKPQAYTVGVGVLLSAFWLWSLLEGEVRPAWAMTAIAVVGGGAIRLLWVVNAEQVPHEEYPPKGNLSRRELGLRMVELLENMLAERSQAGDLREEADGIDERVDYYMQMLREPANWKRETSVADVKEAVGQ